MKLTVAHLMEVLPLITLIIQQDRPMPQKGKYRFARLHAKLLPEFTTANDSRNAMIKAYDTHLAGSEMMPEMQWTVPPEKLDEFNAAWGEFAKQEIEVDVQPVPFTQIDQGDDKNGSITAAELVILGDLVTE